MMIFPTQSGRLATAIAGFLVAVMAASAGAQSPAGTPAPQPVQQVDGSYTLNADVDTAANGSVSGLIAPGPNADPVNGSTTIDDELFITFGIPDIGAGNQFSNVDVNMFKNALYNQAGAFNQPEFNANLVAVVGLPINQPYNGTAENDNAYTYDVTKLSGNPPSYSNSYENTVTISSGGNSVLASTYSDFVFNTFLAPTGNGGNNYDTNAYVSITSAGTGTGANPNSAQGITQLTQFLNAAYQKYGAFGPNNPGATVTFTLLPNIAQTSDPQNGEAYLINATHTNNSKQIASNTPEYLSYGVVPAPAPEPGAWVTLCVGAAGLVGLMAARRRLAASAPA